MDLFDFNPDDLLGSDSDLAHIAKELLEGTELGSDLSEASPQPLDADAFVQEILNSADIEPLGSVEESTSLNVRLEEENPSSSSSSSSTVAQADSNTDSKKKVDKGVGDKCSVCAVNARGKHVYYGGSGACFSCRAFFRRCVTNNTYHKFK